MSHLINKFREGYRRGRHQLPLVVEKIGGISVGVALISVILGKLDLLSDQYSSYAITLPSVIYSAQQLLGVLSGITLATAKEVSCDQLLNKIISKQDEYNILAENMKLYFSSLEGKTLPSISELSIPLLKRTFRNYYSSYTHTLIASGVSDTDLHELMHSILFLKSRDYQYGSLQKIGDPDYMLETADTSRVDIPLWSSSNSELIRIGKEINDSLCDIRKNNKKIDYCLRNQNELIVGIATSIEFQNAIKRNMGREKLVEYIKTLNDFIGFDLIVLLIEDNSS